MEETPARRKAAERLARVGVAQHSSFHLRLPLDTRDADVASAKQRLYGRARSRRAT